MVRILKALNELLLSFLLLLHTALSYGLLMYGWTDFIFRRQAKAVSPGSTMDSPTFLMCIQRL